MLSLSSLQRRLDRQIDRAENQYGDAAINFSEGQNLADGFAFWEASMGVACANFAAGQEIIVEHGLAKTIINEFN